MDDALIEQVYDAALDPGLWPHVLAAIATTCGAVSATLVPHDLAGVVISPGGEDSKAAYAAQWWQHDIIAQAIFPEERRGLFCDWLLIDAERRARHPFYQEFRRAFDLGHNVAFAAEPEPGHGFGISLQFPFHRPDPPDQGLLDRFTAIGRHVSRAMLFSDRTRRTESLSRVTVDLLAALPCGTACLDAAGSVIMANPALIDFGRDGLRIVGRRLRTADPHDQAGLDGLIRHALDPARSPGPALVAIGRPSGRRPLLASALPISARQVDLRYGSGCHAVVTVIDPDAKVPPRMEAVLRALRLSPAEARLAMLIGRGLSPREAADTLALTEGTVRTRLKQVYEKLGVARQSELARLVTQLSVLKGP